MLQTFAVNVLKSTDDCDGMEVGQLVESLVAAVATNLGIHGEPESTRFVGGQSAFAGELYGQVGRSGEGAIVPSFCASST